MGVFDTTRFSEPQTLKTSLRVISVNIRLLAVARSLGMFISISYLGAT